MLNRTLSWFIFFVWQALLLATAIGVLLGGAQAVDGGETPVWIDPPAMAVLLLVTLNFLSPILKSSRPCDVAGGYFIVAFVWTPLLYGMGNFIPQYAMTGAAAGAVAGLYRQDVVSLFLAPLGWGLMYVFVPAILKKPIGSRALSWAGFWGLVLFSPLTGINHFLYSPVPMFLQDGAIVATVVVQFALAAILLNFFATLRGSGGVLRTSLPGRWLYTGMLFYFLACLQSTLQITPPLQKIIHFSDWEIGHTHLVIFGVFGFWILGIMTYLLPYLLKRCMWHSRGLAEWHFWLSAGGLLVMVIDLAAAGLVQGFLWKNLAPWEASLVQSFPFWLVRTIAGAAIIVGQFVFLYNIHLTIRFGRSPRTVSDAGGDAQTSPIASVGINGRS